MTTNINNVLRAVNIEAHALVKTNYALQHYYFCCNIFQRKRQKKKVILTDMVMTWTQTVSVVLILPGEPFSANPGL